MGIFTKLGIAAFIGANSKIFFRLTVSSTIIFISNLLYSKYEALLLLTNPEKLFIPLYIYTAIVISLIVWTLLSLKWFYVDMKRKLITVDNTKNGYPRIIPMNDNVYLLLQTLNKRNEYIFPITTNSLRLMFQRICKKLEIKIRFHDFRHEAISRLFEKGYSIPKIASISGHRTMSQLFRYAHHKL